jgi:hypothetical protein
MFRPPTRLLLEHHHSALALFTPADVFYGRIEAVRVPASTPLAGDRTLRIVRRAK